MISYLYVLERYLNESQKDDLEANSLARQWCHTFADWLMTHNEDTPFPQIKGVVERPTVNNIMSMVVPASALGIDQPDLNFGIGWYTKDVPKKMRGTLRIWDTNDGNTVYDVILIANKITGIDLAFQVNWDSMVHELIHYFEHKRAKSQIKPPKDDYFNDPLEFNAHYHQGLYNALFKLADKLKNEGTTLDQKIFGSFETFRAWILPFMPKSFHLYLNGTYKKKFEARLYKLYEYIKENWPDIEAIKSLADDL